MTDDATHEGGSHRERTLPTAEEFHQAAGAGDVDAVTSALAERPELLHEQDRHGDTALAHAARRGRIEVARFLLSQGASARTARSGKDRGWSPLFWAVGWGARVDMVNLLLDHGADILARADNHGAADDSCLHAASRYESNGDVVSLLLSRGGDALLTARCGDGDSRDNGCTPLHAAVKLGHDGVARILLRHGAALDAFAAAGLGMSDWLAQLGADLGAADANGWTPLHWASSCGRSETVRYLLDKGVSSDARDRYGRTPTHQAVLAGQDAVTQVLAPHGAPLDDFANAALGNAEAVVSVTARDAFGWTPLHWACRAGQVDAVRALLTRGSDPNALDSEGRPALFVAAYDARQLACVEALIEAGADPTARDGADCGILAYDVGPDIARVLRARGATA
jgi:ankyrin repeat protein